MRRFLAVACCAVHGLPAFALAEPPLPDIASARCFERAGLIEIASANPYSTPKEFVGTPWEPTLKRKDEIERAERRREFVRDCTAAGFRLPDTGANQAHNKAVFERQNRDFEAQFDAAARWYAQRRGPNEASPGAQGIPPIQRSPEEMEMKECADSWIHQVGLPRHIREDVGGSDGRTYGASLAFRCGKYGFVDARDATADEDNRRAWERVNDRIAELRKRDERALVRKLVGAP